MLVDIDNYVDRVLITYVAFHPSSFGQKYGDAGKAYSLFSGKYQQDMAYLQDSLAMQQAKLIENELREQSEDIRDEINLFSQLQDGALLESILDNIASGFNDAIYGEYEQSSIETLMQQAQSFSGILDTSQGGTVSPAAVNEFLSLLLRGLSEVASFNPQLINQLTGIGKQLTGPSFKLEGVDTGVQVVNKSDLDLARSIVKELRAAANQFKNSGGSLSPSQFSKVISSIFNKIAGRQIAAKMLGASLADVITMADQAWPTQLPGNIKLVSKNFMNQTPIDGHFSSNILNSSVLDLNVNVNGKNAIIEIGNATQVQWYSGTKSDPRISLVSRQRLAKYFVDPTEKYYAYNILAHSDYYPEEWKMIRASVSASFFRDWVTGEGNKSSGLDKNQFLLINGRLFPVIRIIRNICEDYIQRDGGPVGITISHGVLNNNWLGESGRPDKYYLALKRSRIVNDAINKLIISARFNPNILLKYAY